MFRFRLQRVLELRERHARDATAALASAQAHAEQARAEQAQIVAARDTLAARAALGAATSSGGETNGAVGSSNVGTLRTLRFLLGRIDERVAAAATHTTAAERAVLQREDALRAAYRDQRALDRLRDRQHTAWRASTAAAERQQMDEIALSRFVASALSEHPPTDP